MKKSHKFIRVVQFIVALLLIFALIHLWQTSLLQGQLLLKTQSEKMARLLVQQAAQGAAPALQLQNDEQLQWLATALVQDPKVLAVSIYSSEGHRLAYAQNINDKLEVDAALLVDISKQYPAYVEPVYQDGIHLGYVEAYLVKGSMLKQIKQAHTINMEQQEIMLLVAGLIGFLLSRALSFKRADYDRRRHKINKHRQTKQVPTNEEEASK
nr:AhpA/YtjB family protein [Shewanella sp. NIFS-20-20]